MTGDATIDYEGLAQEAMRGVVRKVLARTAKSGLAGDHHFYISFETEAPGVTLSKRLREKYPREMTIVLQHRFWDLSVTEDRFEVKLTFDGIPERLVVPFSAIKVFFDPSVRFGLQFEDPSAGDAEAAEPAGGGFDPMAQRAGATRQVRKATRRKSHAPTLDGGDDPQAAPNGATRDNGAPGDTPVEPPVAANASSARTKAAGDDETAADAEEPPRQGGAEIVSLDKFRKK